MHIDIQRYYSADHVSGRMTIGDNVFYTLELPWRDNTENISCIPSGTYQWVKREAKDSNKFDYQHIHIKGVKDRTWVLIHIGNQTKETEGCILPGLTAGFARVNRSKKALTKILSILPQSGTITIRSNEDG